MEQKPGEDVKRPVGRPPNYTPEERREKNNEMRRIWYKNNLEKEHERQHKYYNEHKDEIYLKKKEYKKQKRLKDKEKLKQAEELLKLFNSD